MASDHPISSASQQAFAGPQPAPISQATAPPTSTSAAQAVSPPSKQNLRSWWRNFSKQGKNQDTPGNSLPLSHPPYFIEGFMDKEVPAAEGFPNCLYGQGECTSNDGSGPQQVSTYRSGRLGYGKIPPSGGEDASLPDKLTTHNTASGFGRRVAVATFVIKGTKTYNRLATERKNAKQKEIVAEPGGIFGVPLRQSITYANVAISLVDAEGKSYIYGYVPIVVAKCGVYLKEKATNVEGIFRLNGAEKRIKELVVIFNSPDRYGKGLDWDGYTVHDAANVLRRYLNHLPEPIVPLDLYERFREPLRGHALEAVGDHEASQVSGDFDLQQTIVKYQQLITELPPLNRQLLLYILDLLAVFASKSDENRMTSQNLAAIFQPGMLSHPAHDMAPAEYRLSQDVLVFLIENQDNFLIGMRGTAADEKTVQDVQNGGTPPLATPSTPIPNKGQTTIVRSASNASAGADSLRRQGGVRRNVSVNSRHSRQSNGAPSPASPAYGQSPSQTSSGVHRSNTVPSKRSPSLPSNRLQRSLDGRSPISPSFQTTASNQLGVQEPNADMDVERNASPAPSPGIDPSSIGATSLAPASQVPIAGQSQDRLLPDSVENKPDTTSLPRERTLFQRSATAESDKRQPNKLRKKRIPNSQNPSAQSSANSLHGQSENASSPGMPTAQPSQDVAEYPHLASIPSVDPALSHPAAGAFQEQSDQGNLATMPTRLEEFHHSSDGTLKPQVSSQSLRSREESMNEHSDIDATDDPNIAAEQKEKKRRWRISRKKEETLGANLTSPKKTLGSNGGADTSTTSLHSGRGRKSSTGDTIPLGSDSGMLSTHQQTSNDSGPSQDSGKDREEKKGPIDWIKRKMQEAKEEKQHRDAEKEKERLGRGGVAEQRILTSGEGEPLRGPSTEVRRSAEKTEEVTAAPAASET